MDARTARRGAVVLLLTAAACATAERPPGPAPGIPIAYALLEDPGGSATIDEVSRGPLSERFRPSPERTANLGLTPSAWWLRFELDAATLRTADAWILELAWPLIEEATFYSQRPDGTFVARSAGLRIPIREWEIDDRFPSFRVAPGDAPTRYLRVASRETIILPLTLWTEPGFEAERRVEYAVLGFYFGILAVMAASGLLVYGLLREATFLSYACLVASFALWQAAFEGLLSTYVWPDAWWWGVRALSLFAVATVISALVFARQFLSTRTYAPRMDRLSRRSHVLLAVFVVWALVWPGPALVYAATPVAMIGAVWVVATALVVARRGGRVAGYFLASWLFAILAALAQGLRDLGLVGSNLLTDYGLQLGVALSFVALSFGLIGRIFVLRDDLDRSADDVRRLEHEDAAKRAFLATASHDLRQPLHAVGLLLGALRDRLTDTHALDLVDRIRRATEEMAEMFGALLDMSRLDAGMIRPALAAVELSPAFARLADEYGILARQKGLSLRVASAATAARTDPLLFSRILRNLLSNAIHYTDAGEVRLESRVVGDEVLVTVADTGRGISAGERGAAFEPYRRLAGASGAAPAGLGLGLAIVRRLAGLLGHELTLDSEPGRGSTFTLRLPHAPAHASTPAEPAAPAPCEVAPLSGLTVLVVDDDAAVREGMRAQLAAWGCAVRVARSGAEALAGGTEEAPHLIVADHHLGGGTNGLEIIAALRRAAGREIPAVVITGDTSGVPAADARARGLIVLIKPVAPARLRTVLSRMARFDRTAGAE